LKDREKLPQKIPFGDSTAKLCSRVEDHQGSTIGVLFLQLGSRQTPHHSKVEHNSGDSKAIKRIFFHVHAGKHSLLIFYLFAYSHDDDDNMLFHM
jgi:hypothetical protein